MRIGLGRLKAILGELSFPSCPYRVEKDGTKVFHQHEVNNWHIQCRRLLAATVPSFGYGVCSCCRLPWWIVQGHTVMYSDHSGYFAVCESCWNDLDRKAAYIYYEKLLKENEHTEEELLTLKINILGLSVQMLGADPDHEINSN